MTATEGVVDSDLAQRLGLASERSSLFLFVGWNHSPFPAALLACPRFLNHGACTF
jgi:hypothetical protein